MADLILLAEQTVELDEMHALSDGGMSAMVTWQARRANASQAPDMQVVNVDDALHGFHAGANLRRDSRGAALEKDIQGLADDADTRPEDECGDEQRENGIDPACPVSRMPKPPAMTAAVESVSPAMCRKALRRFTSRATPTGSAAMTPFMATPAAATIIMRRGWTATGAERCTASTAMQSEMAMSGRR